MLGKTWDFCRAAADERLGTIDRHAAMAEGESLDIAQALDWARAADEIGAEG